MGVPVGPADGPAQPRQHAVSVPGRVEEDRRRRVARHGPVPPIPPGPQRRCARRRDRDAVRFAARLHRRQAHPQPVPAHRLPARQLPPDRARRKGAAGRRRHRPHRRPQDLRRGPAHRRGRCCWPTARRCSCGCDPASHDRTRRRARGRGGATGCATGRLADFGVPRSSSVWSALAVLALGILAIPYPGPGWAIVFIGLGILATEFVWARRLLKFAKHRYDKVMAWFRGQGLSGAGRGGRVHHRGGGARRCGCSARIGWAGESGRHRIGRG